MKSTFATAFILLSSLTQAAVLERRACAANNVVRAAERLQRESNWCATWLAGTTTISIPAHIATTPVPIISSACSCVYTATASTTSLLRAANTSLPLPPPPPEPTEHVADFEDNDTPWIGFIYLDSQGRGSYGRHKYSASSSPQQLEPFSGETYYRGIFKFRPTDRKHSYEFSNTKAFTVAPQTDYDITFHFRQFGYVDSLVCAVTAQAYSSVQWDGDNISGAFMKDHIATLAFTWQGEPTTAWAKAVGGQINTGSATEIALHFRTDCSCPEELEECQGLGTITAAFDDIEIKVRPSTA
ncbi:uncharacterized protein DFL_009018 [Arthrobotrys flagrans]|uniref:Uncharacterized protein n=1 Tax=Arthrobotrys flagrans TaxID=97331 RepID=A0A436ZQM2_ARTFL|nr:hypothetical protein DFL_009018 [Arthrobotrys flagrans]